MKDYKKWMMEQSKCLIEAANQYGKDNCGRGIIPISTWRIRKEALAHKRQIDEKIENGLIGIWSCLESASSYRARFSERFKYPMFSLLGKTGTNKIRKNWSKNCTGKLGN